MKENKKGLYPHYGQKYVDIRTYQNKTSINRDNMEIIDFSSFKK